MHAPTALTGIVCCSLFSQSGQGAGQAFGQQGVYNNMSITVSMAGGSGGVSSLPPMGQPVAMSNSNLSNAASACSDQQVGGSVGSAFLRCCWCSDEARARRCSRCRCLPTSSAP